jgi:hypothetical protein
MRDAVEAFTLLCTEASLIQLWRAGRIRVASWEPESGLPATAGQGVTGIYQRLSCAPSRTRTDTGRILSPMLCGIRFAVTPYESLAAALIP